MSEPYWTACYTQPGQEHVARAGIEAAGFGAFVPTFVRKGMFRGRLQTVERPLISRYIFVSIDESNDEHIGEIHRELIDGVSHLVGRVHAEDVQRLMVAHASGEFNREEQPRNAGGQFIKKADPTKQKRRRPRPRSVLSLKAQRRKRRREREQVKASKLFPQYANQAAA
jgi:transcription antitermination factor NusG